MWYTPTKEACRQRYRARLDGTSEVDRDHGDHSYIEGEDSAAQAVI